MNGSFRRTIATALRPHSLPILLFFLSLHAPAFAAPPPPSNYCKGIHFLWQHVYNPQRLELQKRCVTVTGVIVSTRREPDGDLHIRLKLDGQFESMLNDGNKSNQGRDLVVEPICDHTVTQTDAIEACKTFQSTIPHYRAGTRVVVTGSYVRDHEHGWMEIHPVTRITQTQ
jgi:hypothetical protein